MVDWIAQNQRPAKSGKQITADIEAHIQSLRPKQIAEYDDNGNTVRVYESRYAEGYGEKQRRIVW